MSEPDPKEGYLYIGYDGTGYFKIGITDNPKRRYKQIKTANPTFVYLWIFSVNFPQVLEAELHSKFYNKKVQGEWFQLSSSDLESIANRIHKDIFGEGEINEDWEAITQCRTAMDNNHRSNKLEWWMSCFEAWGLK